MTTERQVIVTELQAQVDDYTRKFGEASAANVKTAESLEKAVEGFDKLKGAGDKVLGVLDGMGARSKALAEGLRKIADPAERARAALAALEKEQARLAKGPTGLDSINAKAGKFQSELAGLTAAAGPAGLAIAGVGAAVLGAGAAFLKFSADAAIAYTKTTVEGEKQFKMLEASISATQDAWGELVAESFSVGDAVDGLAVLISRAGTAIREAKEATAEWRTELSVVGNLLTGGLLTSTSGFAESLGEVGKEAKGARTELKKQNDELEKQLKLVGKFQKDQEGAANKLAGKVQGAAVIRRGGGGARKPSGFEGTFGATARQFEAEGQARFDAEQEALERQRAELATAKASKAGRGGLDERMEALTTKAREAVKEGDKLAESFRRVGEIDPGIQKRIDEMGALAEVTRKAQAAGSAFAGALGDQVQALAAGEGGFQAFKTASRAAIADTLSAEGDAAIASGAILAFSNPVAGLGKIGAGLAAKAAAGLIAPGSGGGGGGVAAASAAARPRSATGTDVQRAMEGRGRSPETQVNKFYFDGREIGEAMRPHVDEDLRLGRMRRVKPGAVRR